MAITGAIKPSRRTGPDGVCLVAGYVPNSNPTTGGTIQATKQAAGNPVPSSAFTFQYWTGSALADMIFSDDTFMLDQAREGADGWLLHASIFGDSGTSDWASYDNGATWTRIAG